MELFKDTKIDFLKYKYFFMGVSAIIIAAGLFLVWQNGLKYGVDFSGGTAIHAKFRTVVPLDAVRKALSQNGFPGSDVQGFSDPTQVLVRLPQAAKTMEKVEQISNQVSDILMTKAMKETVPEGLKDLNAASESTIRQYLALRDPWGTHTPDSYAGQVNTLMELRKANSGLLPPFDQMKLDPKIIASLKHDYYVSNVALLSTEYVGPQVGAELRSQAKLAIIWSLIGLLVYVWFRFEFLWGASAVICLAHDVLVTLAFFMFTHREISLTVVAAFLTIVGSSLNDTIVIYDRVRDNLKTMRAQPLQDIINVTLNQMLNRTILTNGTIVAVSIVLYLFGGEVINDFAFAMVVGGISGTYSTVYIAAALIVIYRQYFDKKRFQPAKARVTQKV